jgi:hypothetical protein
MAVFKRYNYLLSALPSLEPIGSVPPMSKREFFAMVSDSKGPVRTIEIILLSDDLNQYEAFLSTEIDKSKIDLAVLSVEKAENEHVLPDFLLAEEEKQDKENNRLTVDELWSRYFRHAAIVAKHNHSKFLKAWIGFEVGLRNALTSARALILDLDPQAYLVCPELADTDTDYTNIISAWHAASNPMIALEVLDKARWAWIEEHGDWYSFNAAEIEAYAAKLILLHHWRRILAEKQQVNNEPVY